jgi:hypothetical protein
VNRGRLDRGPLLALLGLLTTLAGSTTPAGAQWSTTYEQSYLAGSFNWKFRAEFPQAERLFYAFDYGHAILYETLFATPDAEPSVLEVREYGFLTDTLLRHPPRLPLDERAIEPEYAKLAPEVKAMFDWAHLLHRQIYDVWSDERLPASAKDSAVQALVRYYRSRRDLAFSAHPKGMELMEGQPYSLAFRKRYPKFNGLIWAYHWLQVGLYDALLAGDTRAARERNVRAATAHFWSMLETPPSHMPTMMPMTPVVAPRFTARYPEAAVIFDNLHAMHDVISDILATPSIPRAQKRAAILAAAARYRDDRTSITTLDEWREMATSMGKEGMGGAAVP